MTVQRESARQIIARCKEAGVTVVAGGPLFTIEHEQFEEVDHFVLNEAELTLPPFLADLERGRARRVYATSEFADIQKTPVPLWELADMRRYATMDIQFSRGCPYNCEFCNVTALLGHRPRTKTAQQIIAELDSLYDLGWRAGRLLCGRQLHRQQEASQDRTAARAHRMAERQDRGIVFTPKRPSIWLTMSELMQMMVEAGFRTVFIGIETPDEEQPGRMQQEAKHEP